jgi:predicted nucleotidyltransferase
MDMRTKQARVDPNVRTAVEMFLQRIRPLYPVEQAFLFGSRARGTHRSDSDVDLAVLLRGEAQDFFAVKIAMVRLAYDIVLDRGYYIQPMPIWHNEWDNPEAADNPQLIRNIVTEGVPVVS